MAVLAVTLGALLALLSVVCADPPAQLDQAGFEAALAGGQPHFVKFFAPWYVGVLLVSLVCINTIHSQLFAVGGMG